MREVELAKTAGFCFGVKRAVELVYQEAEAGQKVCTYGPIIHNEEVVADLEKKGVRVIHKPEEENDGTVIIRSHGVSKDIYDAFENRGGNVVDATCPFVKKIHKIVKEQSSEGRKILVIGNPNHPEVEGIVGWSENGAVVIEDEKQAQEFSAGEDEKLCIVAQTTFNYKKFKELVEIISKKGYNIDIRNTICNATEERQTEARAIASKADAMIVIGGRSSSNTRKLYEICKSECEDTYYIQTLRDLDLYKFNSEGCIGITAGASTPNNLIEEVSKQCLI